MPIQINGSGTITGITAGGYPDATVTADDLAATLDLSGKTVTLPSGTGGKVLQVQYNSTSSVGSLAHSTDTNTPHSYLTVDITPQSETSIIYVSYHLFGEWSTSSHYDGVALLSRRVGGTHNYLEAPASGSRRRGLTTNAFINYQAGVDAGTTPEVILLMQYPDDHNQTTSTQITYFPATSVGGAYTWYYNRSVQDNDNSSNERGVSWIMAMEVAS